MIVLFLLLLQHSLMKRFKQYPSLFWTTTPKNKKIIEGQHFSKKFRFFLLKMVDDSIRRSLLPCLKQNAFKVWFYYLNVSYLRFTQNHTCFCHYSSHHSLLWWLYRRKNYPTQWSFILILDLSLISWKIPTRNTTNVLVLDSSEPRVMWTSQLLSGR